MPTVQELLNLEKETTEINLTKLLYDEKERKFRYTEKGELKIENFPNLTEIKIDTVGGKYIEFANVTKITIADCPNLTKADINTFIENKELEITNCPSLTELDCSYNQLERLDLNNCLRLETLDCNTNKLKELGITNCSNLTDLYCHKNSLTNINLSNKSKLETLHLSENKFSDLSFLEKDVSLTSLKTLYLDKNEINHSLKNLRKLTPDLEEIGIVKTNIVLELDTLPNDLERIYCDNEKLLQSEKQSLKEKKLEICKKLENEDEVEEREEYYDYQTWKRLTDAQKWLDYNYPKDGKIKGNFRGTSKKREKIVKTIELKTSNKWLWGELKLEQFTDLKKLDCSNNYLTRLGLEDCKELTHLNLSNNQFSSVEFLQKLPNKEKLKVLKMSNNEWSESKEKTLEFLKPFTKLEELHIENCPFEGSLEPLKDMKNLSKIYISHSEIDKGLEHLPENCKELYCDLRYQSEHKTIKIVQELGKHLEEGKIRYYNLDKWRREKRDGVALFIPFDKLLAGKKSIRRFFESWKDGDKKDRVNDLKNPKQLKTHGTRIHTAETALKIPSFAGGVFSLLGYSDLGGALSVVAPVAEFSLEQWRERNYEKYKLEWENFVQDSEIIWDTYWELKETFQYIKPSSTMGEVSKALKKLQDEIDLFAEFLDSIKKDGFPEHLKDDWENRGSRELKKIEIAIEGLQKDVSEYRNFFYGKEDDKKQKGIESLQGRSETEISSINNSQLSINYTETNENIQDEYETRIEIPTNSPNYGSIGGSK